jgi:hypothetical protein
MEACARDQRDYLLPVTQSFQLLALPLDDPLEMRGKLPTHLELGGHPIDLRA